MNISCHYAQEKDIVYLTNHDKHITKNKIAEKIKNHQIILAKEKTENIGWLRYGFFWDLIPFMNMLFIDENYRKKGCGKKLVAFWENDMFQQGYNMVLTSSLANENAQHFYRKIGYTDCGSLLLPDEIATEIIFCKVIDANKKG